MTLHFFRLAIILVLFILISNITFAQATRTWVSGVGDDVNPCSRTAPCKTFAGAISKTATGGEISVLDPGGYGSVQITKSITIDGKGEQASILSPMVSGIVINAPGAVVIIRNISINGAGSGVNGIKIVAAKKVFVEDCTMAGFVQMGIEVNTTTPCTLVLSNVTIINAMDAIGITNEGGAVIVNNCRLQGMKNTGITLTNGEVTINHSNISDCKAAVVTALKTRIALSDNVITNNETALQAAGTTISAGNNLLTGNKQAGTPMTVVKLQ